MYTVQCCVHYMKNTERIENRARRLNSAALTLNPGLPFCQGWDMSEKNAWNKLELWSAYPIAIASAIYW